jgi:lipopolysaccharide heptosyltransferase II
MGMMISKILVIKLRAIGDVVLSTAVLPSLRNAHPRAEIHFLTEKPCVDVLSGNPHVDRILTVPEDPWEKPFGTASWAGFFRFLSGFRDKHYDLVLDLFGNPRSAWLTWFSGAPVRAGFDFRGRKAAYTLKIEPRGDRVHEVEFNLDAVRALGLPVIDAKPYFPFGEAEKDTVLNWMRRNGLDHGAFPVALHTWGSWPAKRWAAERFAELADRLAGRYGAKIILLWGPGEKTQAETVRKLTTCGAVLAPGMTLKEMGALLSLCGLVVANDSGPMHIAAAVGTPTVGIFGPTNPKLQGPYGEGHAAVFREGLACLGCNRLECPDLECMKSLSVDDVVSQIDKCIGRSLPPRPRKKGRS